MRIAKLATAASAALLLAGCAQGGLFNRGAPDEFAVARNAPLVMPPDYALVPPAPGTSSAASVDTRAEAINALFGGPQQRSATESEMLQAAERDRAAQGARSVAGDPDTNVVDKGAVTQTILQLPEGDGQEARVSTPQ